MLGSGAFGRVALVRHEGRYYALKTLSKAHVLATGLQASGVGRPSGGGGRGVPPDATLPLLLVLPTTQAHQGDACPLQQAAPPHPTPVPAQEHIKRERTLMAELDSPFVCGLVAAFKDTECLHMLLELVQGGEFFTYLQVRGPARGRGAAVVETRVAQCAR